MAMRIDFVAWHSARPLSATDIAERLASVTGFYPRERYRQHMQIGAGGHTGLVVWMPPLKGLAELCGAHDGALAYVSHPPYGITSHVDIAGTCTPAHVLALHAKVKADPALMRDMVPPLIITSLDAGGGLHIHNDFRGLADLYHHRGDGLQVWSNRVSMPLLFALVEPVESVSSAQLRAIFTYYPTDRTPFANVARVEGGTSVFAGGWQAPPVVQRRNLLLEMLGESYDRIGEPVDFERSRAAVARMLAEIPKFWSRPLRAGLTGGRDSRLILAYFLASGLIDKVQLMTIETIRQDFELAERLVEACRAEGHKVDWEIIRKQNRYIASNNEAAWADFPAAMAHVPEPPPPSGLLGRIFRRPAQRASAPAYRYGASPLLDRMVFTFHKKEGQTMPAGYYAQPVRETAEGDGNVMIGGQSGEVLRASQYGSADLAAGPRARQEKLERGRFRISLARAIVPDITRPYPRHVLDQALAVFRGYLDEARAGGLDDFQAFDYLNVAAQQSRRIDTPKQLQIVCPLAHPVLLMESYKLSAEERAGNAFHKRMTAALAPFLVDLPYSFQIPLVGEEIRRDQAGKPQFWDADAVPGFADILARADVWGDTFDTGMLMPEFSGSAPARLNAYQRDSIGGMLCWRVAHRAYCEVLASFIAKRRAAIGRSSGIRAARA